MSYSRINWKNESQGATPLNAENLNKMDEAIADLDERMTDAERGLRVASPTQLGIVRPDNKTIKVNSEGVITAIGGGGGGGGTSEWEFIENKPFESIDNDTIVSEEGVLKAPRTTPNAFKTIVINENHLDARGADTFEINSGQGIEMTLDPMTRLTRISLKPDTTLSATSFNAVQNKVVTKAITDTQTAVSDIGDAIEELEGGLNNKANKSTTLSGYGITNAYTKTEVDNKIDSTVKTSTVGSDGKTVSFPGVDTSKCYKPYADVGTSFTDRKPVGLESMTLNGTTLTYVLTNASAGMEIKLREIKL